ncbi:hypothetical protein [Megasphaera massiliensis]
MRRQLFRMLDALQRTEPKRVRDAVKPCGDRDALKSVMDGVGQ